MFKSPLFATFIAAASLTAAVALPSVAYAQESPAVRGSLRDFATGKPVAGASVFNKTTGEAAITDDAGEFQFEIPADGPTTLVVIDPSYKRTEAKFDGTHPVSIVVEPISVRGEEIVVEAERERQAAGEATMKREEITRVPGARGDALAAVKNLPGVANTAGFGPNAGIVIRGSSPADSRVFVDGFEIPILYHLGGIQSVLPSEMIDELIYTPGAFGVELGRASAGTIQVVSRTGATELSGFAEVSFINSLAQLQGPLGKKGSFAFAARRSYIDAVIPLFVSDSAALAFTALPRYYDYQGRADYQLDKHLKLSAFVFGSDDKFAITTDGQDPDEPSSFENLARFTRGIASLTYDKPGRYNKLSVSGMTQRTGLTLGTDRFLRVKPDSMTIRDTSRIQVAKGVAVIAGGEAEARSTEVRVKLPRPPGREGDPSDPGLTTETLIDTTRDGTSTTLSAWTALEVLPTDAWKVTGGVRVDNFRYNDVVVAQPRVQSRLKLTDTTSFLTAGGLYTRPADNQDEALQASLKPERAWQSSMGFEEKIAPGINLTTTLYYNYRTDMIVAASERTTGGTMDGNDTYVNKGKGQSFGAEVLLQARTKKFFGWVSYSLARSIRKDDPMSSWRYFDSDQQHNLVALGSYKFGKGDKWQVGGRFQLTTGTPYTPVNGAVFDSDRNTYVPTYGKVNSERNDAQHQLDVRVDRAFAFHDWKLSAYLDVQNVYVNPPVVGYQYNANYTERTEQTGIPILPSFGVRGEF
jgi:hypothetical protein